MQYGVLNGAGSDGNPLAAAGADPPSPAGSAWACTKYSGIDAPGATLTDSLAGAFASARATGPDGGAASAGVFDTVSYAPVTVSLSGTTLVSGAQEALTGQQITATLNYGGPGKISSYNWSVNGATSPNPFKTWDPNAPQDNYYPTQFVALTAHDYTNSTGTFSFYDEHNDTVTATCTATITFPDNSQQTVTATSPSLTFIKPTVTQWTVNNSPNQGEPPTFTAGYLSNGDFVMQANEFWDPIQINVPAPFNLGVGKEGLGTLCQTIISLNYWDFRYPTGSGASEYTAQFLDGNGKYVPVPAGLDGTFPFSYGYNVVNGVIDTKDPISKYTWDVTGVGTAGDGPLLNAMPPLVANDNDGNDWYQATVTNTSWNTWVMYQPPGLYSIWVPVQMLTWGWGGSATKNEVNQHWTVQNGGITQAGMGANSDNYPQWNVMVPPNSASMQPAATGP